MIRVIATFLVAAQAMLPPGMCLCQVVSFGPTARQGLAAPQTPHVSGTEDPGCACPACRKADAAPRPAQAPTAAGLEGRHNHPLPTPTSPCSGCPVVSAEPAARAAILPAPEQVPPDAVSLVLPVRPAALRTAIRPNRGITPPVTPLFVRHCAFLI